MMLAPLALWIVGLTTAPVEYVVLRAGLEAGSASLSQSIRDDGTKDVALSLNLSTPDGRKVTTRTKSVYAPDGRALRREQDVTLDSPRWIRSVIATFTAGGANVVVVENEKRSVHNIPLVRTAPLANPSEFWFMPGKPVAGTSVQSYSLDLETLVWEPTRTTYVGPATLTLHGESLAAHRVDSRQGTVWIDDAGFPLVIEGSQFRLERRRSRP